MFNALKKQAPQKVKKNNCKIKFKNTAKGKEVEFQGDCSREQIEIARQQNSGD